MTFKSGVIYAKQSEIFKDCFHYYKQTSKIFDFFIAYIYF